MEEISRPQNADVIAEAMMAIARSLGPADISPMKLLKLVYIAHGWSLAILGVPLIRDRIEAWKFGPVIPDLYHRIKRYGTGSVPSSCLCNPTASLEALSHDQRTLLEKIWTSYGGMSAGRLSAITHRPNTPWDEIWNKKKGSTYKGALIDDQTIRDHYETMLNERRDPSSRPC